MLTSLSFTSPLLLGALLALPLLFWLVRLTPPAPHREVFPPAGWLKDLVSTTQTRHTTPWWLLVLRMILAATMILAMAGPQRLSSPASTASGPLILLLDDGWAAAAGWPQRLATARALIAQAQTDNRPVALITASDRHPQTSTTSAPEAATRLETLTPHPLALPRTLMAQSLEALIGRNASASIVWLHDSLASDEDASLIETLRRNASTHPLTLIEDRDHPPRAITAVTNAAEAMTVTIDALTPATDRLSARDEQGHRLTTQDITLKTGRTEVAVTLPPDLRNAIRYLSLDGPPTAGAIHLLDRGSQRPRVGILAPDATDSPQPLLTASHYLKSALTPFADVIQPAATATAQAISELIGGSPATLILSDSGTLPPQTREALTRWIEDGGTLIRFAGPRMSAASQELIPVTLRHGDRTLDSALSWQQPRTFAPFPASSPFADLTPAADIKVQRQLLAEPSSDLTARTWASLTDGTPVITARALGKGRLILFHVTADTSWSNLPLSGTFSELLRRAITAHNLTSHTLTSTQGSQITSPLSPIAVLDGFGRLTPPPPSARPLSGSPRATPLTLPGYYGDREAPLALNALDRETQLKPMDVATLPMHRLELRDISHQKLHTPLLLIALFLACLDTLIMILLRFRAVSRAIVMVGVLIGAQTQHLSASDTQKAVIATSQTHLAYILTQNPEIDRISHAGLASLSRFLARRTALEPAPPTPLNPATDELSFYPLLYWPVDPAMPAPSQYTLSRLETYMKQGGTILFDTRDALLPANTSPATTTLRRLLAQLDAPPLQPVPQDHVLTKAFYLLKDFPGRYAQSPLWTEALSSASATGHAADGVSPLLVTANDFAAAWASDDRGQPLFPTQPDDPRQRDLAFRAGVNIVMYVLTGNYKADQVHVPSLLERLGR